MITLEPHGIGQMNMAMLEIRDLVYEVEVKTIELLKKTSIQL